MNEELVATFERNRPRLLKIARRMLGDAAEAEEAVQESWLKTDRVPVEEIRNADAWFTTIVTRVCLDRLRRQRRGHHRQVIEMDNPANEHDVAALVGDEGPERALLMADSIGVALLVVLERLGPLERVTFVLHDVFDLPFDEIAQLINRSPDAARQLASRARRRVRGTAELDANDIARRRALTKAFLDAARKGDMRALLELLDPDIVLTADEQAAQMGSGATMSGSERVAHFFSGRAAAAHLAIINGDVGIIVAPDDRLVLAVVPRFANGRITHLHAIAAPDELARLAIGLFAENGR